MSVIADDETLHRRIHPWQVKQDGTISSGAFTDTNMSVDRASIWTAEESLAEYPGMGLAGFTAGFARNAKVPQEVVADVTDMFHPAHALVKGNKTRATSKQFARESVLVVRPTVGQGTEAPPEAESAVD